MIVVGFSDGDKKSISNDIVKGKMCSKCVKWKKNGFINHKRGLVQGVCFEKMTNTNHCDSCSKFEKAR